MTHLGAREYDPTTGRFISVDPLLEVDKPQTMNGYSYASNSPVTISDPTGLAGVGGGNPGTPGNSGSKRPYGGMLGGYSDARTAPDTLREMRPSRTYLGRRRKKSVGTGNTNSVGTGNTNSGGTVEGDSGGCGSWGFMASVCSGVGETFYGLVSNVPYTAEYVGWIFDSDCRGGGVQEHPAVTTEASSTTGSQVTAMTSIATPIKSPTLSPQSSCITGGFQLGSQRP
ncbi:RHS repeat-associated core domain-containing protein [Streptomyces sp. INA 01156]